MTTIATSCGQDYVNSYELILHIKRSTKVHYDARVTVKNEGITRFSFENNNINLVKLVSTSDNEVIWVGGNDVLYSINPTQGIKPHKVDVTLCKDESKDLDTSSSSYSPIDCFTSENYEPDINEPSLLVNNMLYFTKSEKGLYRINKDDKNDNIWSQSSQAEQTYLKLIAGKGQHQDKVYSFFAEKHKRKDSELEHWIPRVSQSCMNDRGGSKSQLQSSWTSMIYTRLFCGKGYEFTQMIDVATLETDNTTKIYALFRNYWNMSAVCVYDINEISNIFTSSKFISNKVPANHRPGTKHLYVSSSNEVVQIDLQTCHMYGNDCKECRLSRDPYCGWEGLRCTSTAKKSVLDIKDCTDMPEAAPSKTGTGGQMPVQVLPSSKHFLHCKITSHHATYHWKHGETHEECVHSKQDCLYLIESMNKTHEGTYECMSSEDGYNRMVVRYELSMSRSDALSLTPALLLLLTTSRVLLQNLFF
ncbi:semaphorin-7A-like protein [Labeo rohita]|uniref:Semaphorin-7A-like protein n=1 Tax=Labeo rohita TaxID=84645 RepID=A0A498M4Q6_LABRO|nr:semaphorin-7A-like protein [Labeo rohita]